MSLDLFGRPSLMDDGTRNEYDFYPTPRWMTRTLLHWHPEIRGKVVLEPAAGDDDITAVLVEAGCTVITNDIDTRHNTHYHMDATSPEFWSMIAQKVRSRDLPHIAFVVSNFPFNISAQILPHAVALAPTAVVLRKTFLEPTEERGPWLAEHPPSGFIGLPRHSFRGEGNDSVTCDWMKWGMMAASVRRGHVLEYKHIVVDPLAKSR